MTGTSIEQATVEDAEMLKRQAMSAFTGDFEEYGAFPPGIESLDWHRSQIEAGHYYKIQHDGEWVGGICLIQQDDAHMEIEYFFIIERFHNRGIGSQVIHLIEDRYGDVETWYLVTPYKAYRNHHFYEKMGYEKIGEYQPDPDREFILFRYQKKA